MQSTAPGRATGGPDPQPGRVERGQRPGRDGRACLVKAGAGEEGAVDVAGERPKVEMSAFRGEHGGDFRAGWPEAHESHEERVLSESVVLRPLFGR